MFSISSLHITKITIMSKLMFKRVLCKSLISLCAQNYVKHPLSKLNTSNIVIFVITIMSMLLVFNKWFIVPAMAEPLGTYKLWVSVRPSVRPSQSLLAR